MTMLIVAATDAEMLVCKLYLALLSVMTDTRFDRYLSNRCTYVVLYSVHTRFTIFLHMVNFDKYKLLSRLM